MSGDNLPGMFSVKSDSSVSRDDEGEAFIKPSITTVTVKHRLSKVIQGITIILQSESELISAVIIPPPPLVKLGKSSHYIGVVLRDNVTSYQS